MRKPHRLLIAVIALVISSCYGDNIVVEPKKDAKFAYADMIELISVNDQCSITRWGLTHDAYATVGDSSSEGKDSSIATINSTLGP